MGARVAGRLNNSRQRGTMLALIRDKTARSVEVSNLRHFYKTHLFNMLRNAGDAEYGLLKKAENEFRSSERIFQYG